VAPLPLSLLPSVIFEGRDYPPASRSRRCLPNAGCLAYPRVVWRSAMSCLTGWLVSGGTSAPCTCHPSSAPGLLPQDPRLGLASYREREALDYIVSAR
jgi:hypothetical protein